MIRRPSIFIFTIVTSAACAWLGVNYLGWGIDPNQYKEYVGKKVIVNGTVVSDPLKIAFGQVRYKLLPDGEYSQKLLVSSSERTPVHYGDKVYLIGKITEPKNFSDYNYVNFLKSQNVYGEVKNAEAFVIRGGYANPAVYFGIKVKQFVYQKFQDNLPKEQAALLIALIVGQKDLMSKEVVAAFQITGAAHLIAVSGFILTLLIVFAERFSPYIGWQKTWIVCFLIAGVYMIMADFAPGVVRAAIMSGMYMIGRKLYLQYSSVAALGVAATLLIILNPLIVRYDIGFALSFLSILGIILFVPLLRVVFVAIPEIFQIREIICVTVAAQLITLPLTIYYFKQASLVAVFVNLIIIPVIPFVLATGYFLCIPFLDLFIAKVVILPLNFILLVVLAAASVKGAAVAFSISSEAMVGMYLVELVVYLVALSWLKEDLNFDKMK